MISADTSDRSDLLLMAYPDGSWAILDTNGGRSTGSFVKDPVVRPEGDWNIEAAKRKCEAAADLMQSQPK